MNLTHNPLTGRFAQANPKTKQAALIASLALASLAGFALHNSITIATHFLENIGTVTTSAPTIVYSDHDQAVYADFHAPDHQAEFYAASEQRVYMSEAKIFAAQAQNAFAAAARAELLANRGADYDSLFTNTNTASATKQIREANKTLKASTKN